MRPEAVCDFYIPDHPKGGIVIVHGMAEHRQRYDEFARFLEGNGYAAVLYDLPGHGCACSKEDWGWFGEDDGWQTLVNSAFEMIHILREKVSGRPLVLFGHSMGSMIARCLLQENDAVLDGLILSGAPCYQAIARFGLLLAKMVRMHKGARGHSAFLDKLTIGGFNAGIPDARTPFDWLSYNKENVDQYIADPRDGFPFTVQGYVDEISGCIRMHEVRKYHCTKPQLPILFFAGKDDPCTGGDRGLQDSIHTLQKAGYQSICCKRYDHMRHETLQEINRVLVMQDVITWLNENVACEGCL